MSDLAPVAALYVDPRGPYPSLVAEWYDETRDARTYAGPLPVVAHPPCGPWGALRHLTGPGRKRRDDADCGPIAVAQVRRWGGILEQPHGSKLFEHCALLPMNSVAVDVFGGFSLAVEQVAWGHVARKRTWLYLVGIDRALAVRGVRTGGSPSHWVSGGRNPLRKNGSAGGGIVPAGIKVCSAQQRRRTPIAFARWLVELAASARMPPRAESSLVGAPYEGRS